jgi:hypothetical protein
MINLCAPAIIYLIFSITQILIDTLSGLYNTAAMKVIVTIMITLLLNILCQQGLTIVSWVIVFIPFILMTVIVSILLYVFGLDVTTGKLDYKSNNCNLNNKDISYDKFGNIIIYDPEYNSNKNPVYYSSPNIIVPNPHANDINRLIIPSSSSSPVYQS